MSSIVIPTCNSRAKWTEGAKVEAEDAMGVWRWAKIISCNDDGTFNIYLYDGYASGGQEWHNVCPVQMRSRIQSMRPKGTAIRPASGIPRWDIDNGAAFTDAMAAHVKTVTIKKKPAGYWEATDSSDSDCELLEDEIKVQSTPDKLDTRRKAKAPSRKKRKSVITRGRRKSVKNVPKRSRTRSRAAQKITVCKDTPSRDKPENSPLDKSSKDKLQQLIPAGRGRASRDKPENSPLDKSSEDNLQQLVPAGRAKTPMKQWEGKGARAGVCVCVCGGDFCFLYPACAGT